MFKGYDWHGDYDIKIHAYQCPSIDDLSFCVVCSFTACLRAYEYGYKYQFGGIWVGIGILILASFFFCSGSGGSLCFQGYIKFLQRWMDACMHDGMV